MRFRLLALLLLFGSVAFSQTPPSATAVLKEATAKATLEKKKVFIIFHASWCVWCRRMDTSMNDPRVKAFFDKNYEIRHLTVLESDNKKALENPGAEELMIRYNGKGQGIPYWLVFDNTGKFLFDSKRRTEGGTPESGNNTGCPATKEEVDYFISVLEQTSALTKKELATIAEVFRKNDH
jgi:thiol-disulfide isomerase/thioredoxin